VMWKPLATEDWMLKHFTNLKTVSWNQNFVLGLSRSVNATPFMKIVVAASGTVYTRKPVLRRRGHQKTYLAYYRLKSLLTRLLQCSSSTEERLQCECW